MGLDDSAFAWYCAADLLLYDADSENRQVNIANRVEPAVVDKRDALENMFARQLLVHCDADPDRLNAARTDCARNRQAAQVQGGQASCVSPPIHRRQAEIWAVAENLTAAALRMVSEADAIDDPRARARLLVAAVHSLTREMLGTFLAPDAERRSVHELIRRLNVIDRNLDQGNRK